MFIYLLCLSAALLCYTGFQNQSLISLIRSIFSPCSTCCFGLGFSTTKPTCRNTSKDLGHNSRVSFSHPPQRDPRPTAHPPRAVTRTRPPHTPPEPQAQTPKAPEGSPRELFPPADTTPHTLTHSSTPAQPSPEGRDRSPAPPSPSAADRIGPLGRQVTAGPPQPAAQKEVLD